MTQEAGATFDHIGILVEDLDGAIARYEAILGGRFERYVDDEELDCHWARAPIGGGATLELVAPRSDGSPYARDLERRGEGLHHVSFRVTDVVAERDRLEALGLGVLGFTLDHAGWQELFVHPRHTDGVLMHLCVPPPEHA
jgi:methylmalonyl-CoA epimerase